MALNGKLLDLGSILDVSSPSFPIPKPLRVFVGQPDLLAGLLPYTRNVKLRITTGPGACSGAAPTSGSPGASR